MDGIGGGVILPGLGRKFRRFEGRDAGRSEHSRIQPGSYVSSRIFAADGFLVPFEAWPHQMIPARTLRV